MDYGKAIRTARVARGLSQKDLATLAGVNPSYISLVEAGNRKPSAGSLEKLAEVLDVPLYLLMLLGSSESELRGLSQNEADRLGRQLLHMLVDAKPKIA